MLVYPSTEELLKRVDNRYILAMLASRRARQLTSGARPLIDSDTRNRVSLASEEINVGKVVFRYGKHAVIVPEDPVIIAAREAAEREARAKEEEERMEEAGHAQGATSHEKSPTVFDSAGISVEDASLLAERFITHIERMENSENEDEQDMFSTASDEAPSSDDGGDVTEDQTGSPESSDESAGVEDDGSDDPGEEGA